MRIEFWSNTECGTHVSGLIRELRLAGHDAVQRYQISASDYRARRGALGQLWLRTRMYLVYPLQLIASFAFDRGPAVSVVTTNTFFAPLVAGLVAARQRRVVHLVYDLFPDALVESGSIRRGGLIDRVLGFFTRWTFRRSAINVFLGSGLLQFAHSRYGDIPGAVIVPVGSDGTPFAGDDPAESRECVPQRDGQRGGAAVTVLYCGNLGRLHDVSTLASLLVEQRWRPASPEPGDRSDPPSAAGRWHFLFHATGSGCARLKAELGWSREQRTQELSENLRITIAGGLADADWEQTMRSADVALVTMSPGAERVVMPSKTYSAMAAGQAILAVCPRASDLAQTVLTHDCGWVIEPGDTDGLGNALDAIARDNGELLQKRRNAWRAGQGAYASPALAERWLSVLSLEPER